MKVISASRREDLVAFNFHELLTQYKKIGPDSFWVFWTKNPKNLLTTDIDYSRAALQLTITGLGKTEIEPGVPETEEVLATTAELIRNGFNPKLINWRFDPFIPGISSLEDAEKIAQVLSDLGIQRCVTSFITWYGKVKTRWPDGVKTQVPIAEQKRIAETLRDMLMKYGFDLYGCAQPGLVDIVKPAKCIDGEYYSSILGEVFASAKDPSQRKSCGCTASVDIGKYRSCPHSCKYCYARPE